ncbi:MAG: DUF1648 domain-containing protein [Lachnospiraceae bacterium]|nr:DUF1648 domain-containing protein [Lachnospiraceae bacterium]
MENRMYFRTSHKIAEIIAYAVTVVSVILAIVFAATSEGEIATHFNLAGQADKYGSPWSAIVLPIVMLLSNLMMLAIFRFVPISSWNMPAKVTDSNRPYVYNDIIWVVLITMLMMAFISLLSVIGMFFFREHYGVMIIGITVVGMIIMTVFIIKSVIDSKRYA